MFFDCFLDAEGNFFDITHFPDTAPLYPFRGCYLIEGKLEVDFGFTSLVVTNAKSWRYSLTR